ncbi:biotin-dependent carboxyltransferase family protein [Aliiglaciecola sp. 3_MG-2023]|uniref:5-oxoprolinase subunit C family protein n=1 Tax=Aliiglaciecola sp. 3_MG-2023 TaxID=3062644 RepID=UPI0026E41475|nr:biotin-dependent carboxyltransferase family protein [Aliiglaciecola sp. 3_MG-2023]MDO6693633.1 biotin-dependent carboxyltransferase family protein [Aliiglaciecola sp. 3_MG-2023]
MNHVIEIMTTGLQSMLVDSGRRGYQHLGITSGGPADRRSCLWANWLCDNKDNAPSIEVVGCGFSFKALSYCQVAISGGATEISINDRIFLSWRNFKLNAGDVLTINKSDNGLRSYVAVHQGFHVPEIFGSCTTVMRDRLGGLTQDGQVLKLGDQIAFYSQTPATELKIPKIAPLEAQRSVKVAANSELTLRLVEGYQINDFSAVAIRQLYLNQYVVSPDSSRMACKLTGNPIAAPNQPMLSEGITRGAVQIPQQGLPIIMLDDRQTVGGYYKVGSVLSVDCDKLSQATPGCKVTFSAIDIQTAHNLVNLAEVKHAKLFTRIQSN